MVLRQDWRYQHRRRDISVVVKTATHLPKPAVETFRDREGPSPTDSLGLERLAESGQIDATLA
jgi:hypothetical protein